MADGLCTPRPFCCRTPVLLSPRGAPACPPAAPSAARDREEPGLGGLCSAPQTSRPRGPRRDDTAVPTRHREGLVVVQNIHITEFYGACALGLLGEEQRLEGEPSKPLTWEKRNTRTLLFRPLAAQLRWTLSPPAEIPGARENLLIREKILIPFETALRALSCAALTADGACGTDTWDLGRHGRSRVGVRSRGRAVWTCPPVWGGSGSARIAQPGAEEGESKPGLEPGGSETAVLALALLTVCGEFLNKINNVSTAGSFDDCSPIGWFKGTRTM